MVSEILLDFLHGEMIRGLQRADRCAENLRHLLILHLVVIFHVEHESLLLRQGRHRLPQLQGKRVAIDIFIALYEVDKMAFLIVKAKAQALALL